MRRGGGAELPQRYSFVMSVRYTEVSRVWRETEIHKILGPYARGVLHIKALRISSNGNRSLSLHIGQLYKSDCFCAIFDPLSPGASEQYMSGAQS